MDDRSNRVRLAAFWLFVIACAGGAIGYVWWRVGVTPPAAAADTPLFDAAEPRIAAQLDDTRAAPHVLFLSTRADAFGQIGVAPLATLESSRIYRSYGCERAYFGKTFGLCLVLSSESVGPRAVAHFVDARFQPLFEAPLPGLPIRARISADERYAASTVFVTGESYTTEGFTTRTTIFDLTARTAVADLEQFAVERDGRPFKNVDFNFWGVSFHADSNRFFATLGTGGKRFLVEGDLARRQFRVVADDVECPSVSPDGRTVVFKRQRAVGTGWQIWAMDLQSREAWPVTEDGQDVDDQVEWLDDARVIYGMVQGPGIPETSLSLWVSDARRGAGKNQQLFMRSAWSATVIR